MAVNMYGERKRLLQWQKRAKGGPSDKGYLEETEWGLIGQSWTHFLTHSLHACDIHPTGF